MSLQTARDVLDHIEKIVTQRRQKTFRILFHGGEPLMAGYGYFKTVLDEIKVRFGKAVENISIQSNLWLLNEDYCQLFIKHNVNLGTSLDGPKEITDMTRGRGYFERTMAGISLAKRFRIPVGNIATFTPATINLAQKIFQFFLEAQIDFSFHPAVPSLTAKAAPYVLPPQEYGKLLSNILNYYIPVRREIAVATIDNICQSVVTGKGQICTFRGCLGMFLAYDPLGNIFPCQRFSGQGFFQLGKLDDNPSWADLMSSPTALRMAKRDKQAGQKCGACPHYTYCRGGCVYNSWVYGEDDKVKDPYCQAYSRIFSEVQQRLAAEFAAPENIKAVVEEPWLKKQHPLFRYGPVIELSRKDLHPRKIARTAKRIIAAVELARWLDDALVAERLVQMRICRTQKSALASLQNLRRSINPATRLNNLYLHITYYCQLRCTHCYAKSTAERNEEMPVSVLKFLIMQARAAGFRKVIITGGEPLLHRNIDSLIAMLRHLKSIVAPMNIILRSNLAMPLSNDQLQEIAAAFDQVVVSIDGDENHHDRRRGYGAYRKTVTNLELFQRLAKNSSMAELSIAAALPEEEIRGMAGKAVRELANRLGIRRTRFRPLLPLGRAAAWDESPRSPALGGYLQPMELIEAGFYPIANCGLGQNLYVKPNGDTFPCYALHNHRFYLGNVMKAGLKKILLQAPFARLSLHTVDTNRHCKHCDMRYLCGGACRAWDAIDNLIDLDAPPGTCTGRRRSKDLLQAAMNYLQIK